MNKRMMKKEYKRIREAKWLLDDWTGNFYKAVNAGFVDPKTRKTAMGRAIRKVVQNGNVLVGTKETTFLMPATRDVMEGKGKGYSITIEYQPDPAYAPHDWESVEINLLRGIWDTEYRNNYLIPLTEEIWQVKDFVREWMEETGLL